jgi:hypothetical protein
MVKLINYSYDITNFVNLIYQLLILLFEYLDSFDKRIHYYL